jgi:hypothetical protein
MKLELDLSKVSPKCKRMILKDITACLYVNMKRLGNSMRDSGDAQLEEWYYGTKETMIYLTKYKKEEGLCRPTPVDSTSKSI